MTGSIRERAPGVFELRVYNGVDPVTKKKRWVSRVSRGSKRAANIALANLVTEVAQGKHAKSKGTVEHMLTRYVAEGERLGRAENTLRTYRGYIDNNIVPAIGAVTIEKLTAEHLDDFYDSLYRRGLKPATIRQHHAIIRAALNKARRWQWVRINVADDAEPPPLGQVEVEVPPIAQVRLLLDRAYESDPTLATMVFLAGTTGARRGELCGLRWSDIEDGALTIRRSVRDAPGAVQVKDTKTHQVRRLAIDGLTAKVLERHRLAQRAMCPTMCADPYVFSQAGDASQPYRPDRVTGFMRRMDLGVNMKSLRHLVGTEGVTVGDVRNVAGRLGHGSGGATTMKVYSHRTPLVDVEIAKHMGELLSGKPGKNAKKRPRARPKP